MVDKHQNKWLDHLPFILLGKRVSLQPDIGASPSEMAFGMNVRIPGQILHDPGSPPTEQELHQILEDVRNKTNKKSVQPSNHSKPEEPLPGLPSSTTHVYTRQHKAQGLQVPYEGPFRIVGRPSRSTVKIEVGKFKSGEARYETRHINDIKAAHPLSLAAPAQRPTLGRPPQTSAQPEHPQATDAQVQPSPLLSDRLGAKNASSTESEPANKIKNKQPVAQTTTAVANKNQVSHATSIPSGPELSSKPLTGPPTTKPFTRLPRSTRNPNPMYVDSIWSASPADLDFINRSINTRNMG